MNDNDDKICDEVDNEKLEAKKKEDDYMKRAEKYKRVRESDPNSLALQTEKAKGPNRNMSQFATEMDVAPSSISRLINRQARGVSIRLLAKIATYADKSSGVTFDSLMEAHGMSMKDEMAREQYNLHDRREFIYNYQTNVKRIILDEFFKRDYYPIRRIDDDGIRIGRRKMRFDLVVETSVLNEKNTEEKKALPRWAFNIMVPHPDEIRDERYALFNARFFGDRLMRAFSAFYISSCEGDRFYDRISYVIDSKKLFDAVINEYSYMKLKNEISIILIDYEKGTIEDEYIFQCDPEPKKGIFDKDKIKVNIDDNEFNDFDGNDWLF